MSEQWITQLVKPTHVEDLAGFVTVVFDGDHPVFKFRNGELWKSACSIKIWDDGRMHVRAEKHLTARQRKVVGGLAEEYWRAGPERCRREKWRRIRKTAARPVASRATSFWVRADADEPGYAVAHADYRATVAQSHALAHTSRTERWLEDGADEAAPTEVTL